MHFNDLFFIQEKYAYFEHKSVQMIAQVNKSVISFFNPQIWF